MSRTLTYALFALFGVFISGISQVLLKKSAGRQYSSAIREYLNPLVIVAYAMFFGATLLSVYAYKGIPLSMGPILDATGYVYVTIFGITIFHEKLNARRILALVLIILGIVVYSLGL
ncbi:EamA family transporter [Olsenella umbonata]|jgi:multidrug transporter EmrE-like cation transporter|uniref:EamA family transporter n=1 Tax=Parafannyhessea umbonata TaxID=604330 RepID=A0A7X9TC19_9ACTN|nr:EamA family transporter [Parafannyhessea umbonata]NMF26625.1 EamA family transporter [Parafannyhessea umbonata]